MKFNLHDIMTTPSKYVTLPSEGKFYADDVLVKGTLEVAVSSMSARHEMKFKNPDALMNGEAVIDLIRDCAPSVLKAEELNNVDIEAILLAIKSASGDKEIEYSVECPECDHKGSLTVKIEHLLDRIVKMKDSYTHALANGIIVDIVPTSWKNHIILLNYIFKQQTLLKMADYDMTESAQKKLMNELFDLLTDLKTNNLKFHIKSATYNGSVEDDPEALADFINLMSTVDIDAIEEIIKSFNDEGIQNKHTSICSKCEHEWEQPISRFDPSSFFSLASAQQTSPNEKK